MRDDHAESADAHANGLAIAKVGAQAMIGPAYSGQQRPIPPTGIPATA